MEDSPMDQHNQNTPPDTEQDEDDPSTRCPYFTSSDQFHFLTVNAYLKREEANSLESESEYQFGYVRPMNGVVGVLDNPHGSVKLRQGKTTVIAAVYGPSDIRMSKELPHRAAVDVLFRPKVTGSGNTNAMLAAGMMDPQVEERAIEQTLTSILESVIFLEDHLQAGFNVILHEVEDDGCLLSTCINAASVALLNAGCSLRCMFASVTVCVCGDSVVIDPSREQVEVLKKRSQSKSTPFSKLTFTITNNTDKKSLSPQVLHTLVTGTISPITLSKVYALVTDTQIVSELFGFFGRVISSDVVGVCGSGKGGDGLVGEKLEGEKKVLQEEDEDDDEEDGEVLSDE